MNIPDIEKPKNSESDIPYIPPTQSERRSGSNCLVIGAAVMVALLCVCCGAPFLFAGVATAIGGVIASNEVEDTRTEILELGSETPTLEVRNRVGDTVIVGEDDVNEIRVEIVRRANGITESDARESLEDVQVEVERDGDTYRVEVTYEESRRFFSNPSAHLTITVPRDLNIVVETNVGRIDIEDVRVVDRLDLESSVGNITFSGQIGPRGEHRIVSNVGEVRLELDEESAFRLEVTTEVGEIDNELNLDGDTFDEDVTGGQLIGTYNGGSDAELTISSEVGDVTLED